MGGPQTYKTASRLPKGESHYVDDIPETFWYLFLPVSTIQPSRDRCFLLVLLLLPRGQYSAETHATNVPTFLSPIGSSVTATAASSSLFFLFFSFFPSVAAG